MPDTSTATTASNAETRAAGSKIIGFILGGGGAIVDKLFDLSNFFLKDAAGRLGVGTSAPATAAEVSGDSPVVRATQTNAISTLYGFEMSAGGLVDGLLKASLTTGEVRIGAGRSVGWGGFLTFHIDTVEKLRLTSAGNLSPGQDGVQDIGTASFRFDTLFAAVGAINTSDGRSKSPKRAFLDAELNAAKRIAQSVGVFQFLAAIAAKGEAAARLHIGVIAQDVWAIMADEGLIEPLTEGVAPDCPYAFLCYDEWEAAAATDAVFDGDGEIVTPAREACEAGNRFGIRPDQLSLFLIAAQEARLAALEAA